MKSESRKFKNKNKKRLFSFLPLQVHVNASDSFFSFFATAIRLKSPSMNSAEFIHFVVSVWNIKVVLQENMLMMVRDSVLTGSELANPTNDY